MPDPLTSTLRLTEPTIGGDTGLWAGYLNNNMIFTDQGVNQTISVSIPDTNVTLVADGTTSDQARYYSYNFTGALTANRTVTLPNVQRQGWATNNTTGGFNVILSAGGATVSLPPDGVQRLFNSDGSTNITLPSIGFGNAWQTIGNYSFTGVSTQAIALPTTFRRFRLTVQSFQISISGSVLFLKFSSNGGSTYASTAYAWVATANDTSNVGQFTSSANDGGIPTTTALFSGAGEPNDIIAEIFPGTSSARLAVRANAVGVSTVSLSQSQVSGTLTTAAVQMNFLQLAMNAGTMTGIAIMEALP